MSSACAGRQTSAFHSWGPPRHVAHDRTYRPTCTCFSIKLFSNSCPLFLLTTGSSGTVPETTQEDSPPH